MALAISKECGPQLNSSEANRTTLSCSHRGTKQKIACREPIGMIIKWSFFPPNILNLGQLSRDRCYFGYNGYVYERTRYLGKQLGDNVLVILYQKHCDGSE